jgi:hypothetical protein
MLGNSRPLVCVVLMLTAFARLANASQQAYNPYPANGVEDVPHNVCLSWSPADEEPCPPPLTHYVFLSTDYDSVANGDLSSLIAATENNEVCVEDLCLGGTYYWRVDSVWDCYTADGDIWSSTVIDYTVVDDMESYDAVDEPNADPNRYIFNTWVDGAGDEHGIGGNGTGSTLWVGLEPCEPAHSGAKSMEYWYDNYWDMHDLSWSEAWLPFSEPQDWATLGANVLTLFFYGDPDNDAEDTEQMYVALDDSDGNYAEVRYPLQDMGDIKVKEWQRWNIPLTDFNGVNLASVEKLYIGFGKKDSWEGGNGIVYFDDIRLYAAGCIPRYGPTADFNGDCFVGFDDYAMLTSRWLKPPGTLAVDIAPEPLDDFVDLQDLAVLADSWLERQLWPP